MKRNEIKDLLPSGYGPKISNLTGFSTAYVYRWVNGKIDNVKIESAIMGYLAEILEEKKKLRERIKQAL